MSEHTKRIAIVTGATSGIGEATARKLVTEGICVIGNGRNVEKLASLETELGDNFYGIAGDITQEGVIESLFDAAQNQFGKHPDIVVANAGRGLGGSVIDSDLAEFQKVLQINVTSPFSAVYGATKFAVHALAEGLRREVGPKGIRVSLVEPGILLSGFQEVAGYSDATVSTFTEKWGPLLIGKDIADTIHFMVNQPPHVHISEIMVRPTRQDYP